MQHGSTDERWMKRLRVIGWSIVAGLLLLPAVAMQFTPDVDWSIGDLIFAAVLLIGTGILAELLVRRSRNAAYRWGAALALGALLLLVWSNAAVGFVGSGANVANVLYAALAGVIVVWSLAVRFKAKGMALGMFATAIAQALITALAFATHLVRAEETFIIPAINAFFIVVWTAAALLFRKADRQAPHGQ